MHCTYHEDGVARTVPGLPAALICVVVLPGGSTSMAFFLNRRRAIYPSGCWVGSGGGRLLCSDHHTSTRRVGANDRARALEGSSSNRGHRYVLPRSGPSLSWFWHEVAVALVLYTLQLRGL